jgi:hypothetical protein
MILDPDISAEVSYLSRIVKRGWVRGREEGGLRGEEDSVAHRWRRVVASSLACRACMHACNPMQLHAINNSTSSSCTLQAYPMTPRNQA